MSYAEGYNAAKRMVLSLHKRGATLYEYDSEKEPDQYEVVVDERLCDSCTQDYPCETVRLFDAAPEET